MTSLLVFYAACAVAYATLAGFVLSRPARSTTALWMTAASAGSAAWAGCFCLLGAFPRLYLAVPVLDVTRAALWYGFILHLYKRSLDAGEQVRTVFQPAGLALLILLAALIAAQHAGWAPARLSTLDPAAHLGFAVCGILLVENLYLNTPADRRWNVNLLCVALGGTYVYDLLMYADDVLFHRLSLGLVAARVPVAMLAAPLLGLAVARNRRWWRELRLSHDVAFHSFTLIASGLFLLAVALTAEVMRGGGSQWGRVAGTTFLFAGILAVAVVLTSGSTRSRIRGLVVENFFSHRYDYRKEWMRCVDAMTAPEAFVALHTRAVRAAAAVVDSPAGALFVRPPEDVAFRWAGSWNLPAATAPIPPGHPIVPLFRAGDWIVRLDEHSGAAEWFPELPRAWIALPLRHAGAVIGFVVLTRPRAQFTLDREAYDLLRVIGHEIASRVAEQRAVEVLSQTRRLRQYSQRFAFVVHDIKNVSGQLSMLLSNAEVHADNPDFQRDMLATVRASVGKITRLLSRLEAERQEREHALVTPAARIRPLVETCRLTRGREVVVADDSGGAGAAIDPDAFDAVLAHLLNNAAEASPPGRAVHLSLRLEAAGMVIDISDEGPGMPPEFVRDELFQPLRSTKASGHGIGAFQSRELLREAGGDLLVISRLHVGTTMRVILPVVRAAIDETVAA